MRHQAVGHPNWGLSLFRLTPLRGFEGPAIQVDVAAPDLSVDGRRADRRGTAMPLIMTGAQTARSFSSLLEYSLRDVSVVPVARPQSTSETAPEMKDRLS
jgi:hypothetical protein